eukprot:TRINITY_DN3470_c0_g1_i1.p1 TRINITY_DN3470_c0_g1~~TRINITY_DN3470_c0_g1_i1.p1  ORF type:complete len:268 (+),score=36.42 TRINITY_DN3470_c0_g1_i1:58-861(+)
MSEEEKLREEAARRLARRRRKMENASERLSMITGQPAESIRLIDSYSIDPREDMNRELKSSPSLTESNTENGLLSNYSNSISTRLTESCDDSARVSTPSSPLASQRSAARGSRSRVEVHDSSTPDPPLEALLPSSSAAQVPASSLASPAPEPVSNLIWILLAIVTFLVLQSEYSYTIGHSMFPLFILTVITLFLTGRMRIDSTVGSVISTVLVLCGLKASLAKWIIKTAEFGLTVHKYFVVFLATFLVVFQLYHHVLVPYLIQGKEI